MCLKCNTPYQFDTSSTGTCSQNANRINKQKLGTKCKTRKVPLATKLEILETIRYTSCYRKVPPSTKLGI